MATDFAARIKHWADRSGLSGLEIARRMDRDRTTVYKVLNGTRMPSTELLEDFARVFGISLVALLSDPPPQSEATSEGAAGK